MIRYIKDCLEYAKQFPFKKSDKLWFKDPLLTLTAIKYCELHFLLKEARGGKA